ncbi:MAG: signal peptidase II [Anaerolineae bacterium]
MLKSPMVRRWLLLLMVAAVVIFIDQFSKWVIVNTLQPYEFVPLLPPFLYLTFSANTGAAFGFLPDAGTLFLVLAVVIVGIMLFTYPRVEAQVTRIAIGLVIGGALGNAIDRLHYGHVVDFVHIVVPGIISNVSNFADHAIVIGVLTFAVQNWLEERREKQRKAHAAHEEENATLPIETLYGEEPPTPSSDQ